MQPIVIGAMWTGGTYRGGGRWVHDVNRLSLGTTAE